MHRYGTTTVALATLLACACGASKEDGGLWEGGGLGGPGVGQGGAQDFGQFRQILEDGGIPGPQTLDDVGFFNEHKIAFPAADCGDEVCVHGNLGVMGNMISGSNCTLVSLGMNTPVDPEGLERPPLNLAIAIDTSGSMAGANIDYVRTGLDRMLDALEPEDRVTLITFDSLARVEAQYVAGDDPTLATAISDLRAAGSTNLYDGLRLAYDSVEAHMEDGRQNRVILLSDGVATAGITSEPKIVDMSAAYNDFGVGLSTIGMGEEFDPELMRSLSEAGAGAFYFLEDPRAVEEVFTEEVQSFMVPLALDVALDLSLSPHYQLAALYGTKLSRDTHAGATIEMPSVQIAHRISTDDNGGGRRGGGGAIVAELIARDGAQVTDHEVGSLTLTYTRPGDGEIIRQSSGIRSPFAPGVNPDGGFFGADGVEKSFVMLNIFVGFEMASLRASVGDDGAALDVLLALEGAVADWVEGQPDADIEDDLRYIRLFIANLRTRGADDPAPDRNPPEPWPRD